MANWLQAVPATDPGRPPLAKVPVARILNLPSPPAASYGAVVAITTAPFAQLYLDGVPQGTKPAARDSFGAYTSLSWPLPPVARRKAFSNASLEALNGTGAGTAVVATHTVLVADVTAPRHLQLTLDVPSRGTGTGEALVLDGCDTALLRASIVDAAGALVPSATDRVVWRVVSGPGRVVGVSNGDPTSHEQMKSHSVAAWGGLARGFVQVTMDCVSQGRERARQIDVDAARSPTKVEADAEVCRRTASGHIVVAASADALSETRLTIPISVDEATDGPLAVAAATAHQQPFVFSYLPDFVG